MCTAHTLTGGDVLTGKSTLNDKDVSQLNFDRRELQITSVGRERQVMDSMSFSHPQRYSGSFRMKRMETNSVSVFISHPGSMVDPFRLS